MEPQTVDNRPMDRKTAAAIKRALTAETNEATFRQLLESAYYVLVNLPTTTTEITHLRYRILDTLNETPSVKERTAHPAPAQGEG